MPSTQVSIALMAHRTMFGDMATRAEPERLADEAPDQGYSTWKRAKIERGLEQSHDRSCMIPVERLWVDLGLER